MSNLELDDGYKLAVERPALLARIRVLEEALKPFAYGWTIGAPASHEAAVKVARTLLANPGPPMPVEPLEMPVTKRRRPFRERGQRHLLAGDSQ